MAVSVIHLVFPVLAFLCYRLRVRLLTPHPKANPFRIPAAELQNVSYDGINMLNAIPRDTTNMGYAVIGGSGFVGRYIVRLLLLRGERNIRILDIDAPTDPDSTNPAVSFVRTDIRDIKSVRDALTAPFPSTGHPPTVIFHTAALIRFWERVSYSWHLSYDVNVRGTQNVLTVAANDLPHGETMVIFTSTSDVVLPRPHLMRLGLDFSTPPWDRIVVSDGDDPLPSSAKADSNYARSKALAERAVIEANGRNGLRTGIIRPGFTIMGPNDRLLTSTLTMPKIPDWGGKSSQTNVCVWDVAAAHLQYEDALRCNSRETSGQAFLVTGKSRPWSTEDIRHAVKDIAHKPVTFVWIDPFIVFTLSHLVEAFLFLRYYFLLPLYILFSSKRPNVDPSWIGELVYMQPMMLDCFIIDVVIDDTRARKILGYRPQWETEQCIKYTIDEFESGRWQDKSGLTLKSF